MTTPVAQIVDAAAGGFDAGDDVAGAMDHDVVAQAQVAAGGRLADERRPPAVPTPAPRQATTDESGG